MRILHAKTYIYDCAGEAVQQFLLASMVELGRLADLLHAMEGHRHRRLRAYQNAELRSVCTGVYVGGGGR